MSSSSLSSKDDEATQFLEKRNKTDECFLKLQQDQTAIENCEKLVSLYTTMNNRQKVAEIQAKLVKLLEATIE